MSEPLSRFSKYVDGRSNTTRGADDTSTELLGAVSAPNRTSCALAACGRLATCSKRSSYQKLPRAPLQTQQCYNISNRRSHSDCRSLREGWRERERERSERAGRRKQRCTLTAHQYHFSSSTCHFLLISESESGCPSSAITCYVHRIYDIYSMYHIIMD